VCPSKILRKGGFLQTTFSKVHSYENPFSRSLKISIMQKVLVYQI
jgi:hypothetical protein